MQVCKEQTVSLCWAAQRGGYRGVETVEGHGGVTQHTLGRNDHSNLHRSRPPSRVDPSRPKAGFSISSKEFSEVDQSEIAT